MEQASKEANGSCDEEGGSGRKRITIKRAEEEEMKFR